MDTVKEEGIRKAAAKAAKAAAGAPVAGFVSFVSNSANMVAVSAGGTNFLLKCPTCGSYVRRDAPSCPVCRRSSAAP